MRNVDPLTLWREEVGRRYLALDFKPANDDPFKLSFDMLFAAEGLRLGRLRHSAGATLRDRELIQQDSDDSFALLMPRSGSLNLGHQGWAVDVNTSDATMLHNCETGHVGAKRPCDYVALILPSAGLKAFGVRGEDLIGRHWKRPAGALQLLKGYLACLVRAPSGTSQDVLSAAARHILELTALAAHDVLAEDPPGEKDGDSVRAARFEMALDYIARNISDPELSVSCVAASQKVSARYLHVLFEAAGLHFVAHVNEMRLLAVFRDLDDPLKKDQTIADLAFNAGFSDISHFNRLFRRRFDATPSAVRARHSGT